MDGHGVLDRDHILNDHGSYGHLSAMHMTSDCLDPFGSPTELQRDGPQQRAKRGVGVT